MPTKKVTIKAKDTSAEIPSTATEAKTTTKKIKKTSAKKEVHKVCTIDNCKREYKAKGYCKFHYKEWRHGKFGMARYKTCKDIGCRKPMSLNKHGYCEEHFNNYYVKGMSVTVAPTEKKEEKVA